MGFTPERARVLVDYIDFKIEYRKTRRISDELEELAKKYIKSY